MSKTVTTVDSYDVSASDQSVLVQPNMCHPKKGTRLKISPSGISVSPIASEGQVVIDAQKNNSGCKRRHGTSWYSQLAPEQKEAYLQRGREYKRRRKSQDASCSHAQDTSDGAISSNLQNTVGYTHVQLQGHTSRQHEDLIYLPKDSFPAIQGNLSTN